VKEAVDSLMKSLTPVAPNLSKGMIILSFFERREVKGFFGLVSNQESVYFERWRLPVLVNDLSLQRYSYDGNGMVDGEAADRERRYFLESARAQVQQRLITILEVRNSSLPILHFLSAPVVYTIYLPSFTTNRDIDDFK
jgi:hypothetical protein